jgi:hypothetical protein
MLKFEGKTISEIYAEPTCEVSKQVLRARLTAGESMAKAKKLRNFVCCGMKYRNLWELSKETLPLLTYQQLAYRVCVQKMSPDKAVHYVLLWVEGKRQTGVRAQRQRTQVVSTCALSRMNPSS